jgi:hypothetical protein
MVSTVCAFDTSLALLLARLSMIVSSYLMASVI